MEPTNTSTTPAVQIALQLTADDLKPRREPVAVDRMAMAAAHVRSEWGDYGYSLAVEMTAFSGTLFRGHHSDGSDFYFVVDRFCNVADLPQS